MSRPQRPWLIPVASLVLALAWIGWLAWDSLSAGAGDVSDRASPSQAAAPPPASPQRVTPPATADRIGAPAQSRSDAMVSSKPGPTAAPAEAALQLGFTMPPTVQVGEGFDVRVSLMARQPIGRIVVGVAYDPVLLKARTLEELDYAQRALGERMFRIDNSNDGRIELSLGKDRGNPAEALPASVPLVQFEALAAGPAQVRVESIAVSDPNGGTLTWSATGREIDVVVN
jgi:hypothetical protein